MRKEAMLVWFNSWRRRARHANDRLKSRTFLTPVLLVLLMFGMAGCERSAEITVSTDNPPVIKLSGESLFDRLEVRGPLPERMDDERRTIMWRLVPSSSPHQLDDLPTITYGVVPPDLVQSEPQAGPPPVLMEGRIYNFSVTTRGSNHPSKTVVIRNGKAEELKDGAYKVDNSNISSFVPTELKNREHNRRIFFVPLMNYSSAILDQLAEYEQQKYGIRIEIKPNLSATFSSTYNEQTGQHVAEKIIEHLKREYPSNNSQDRGLYIAFLPQDMYIKRENSRFAYLYHEGDYSVISDARLAIFADESGQKARLRKLVNRLIGSLYYNLPLTEDKRSVLFKDLRGPDDLDRMSEDF